MSSFRQLMMKAKGGGNRLNPLIKIVGTPTITDEFIYKDVSIVNNNGNYIYIDEIFPLSTANTWSIQLKLKYDVNTYNTSLNSPFFAYEGGTSRDGYSPVFRAEGTSSPNYKHLRPLISAVGYHNWNINVSESSYALVVGQEYYFEFGFDGTKYYIKDLDNNTILWYKNDTRKVECSNKMTLLFGTYAPNGDLIEMCSGEMDLTKFKVFVNDNLYFSAVI